MDELKCRKRVLRRLGFATSSDVIEMKGRVACEISRYKTGCSRKLTLKWDTVFYMRDMNPLEKKNS